MEKNERNMETLGTLLTLLMLPIATRFVGESTLL